MSLRWGAFFVVAAAACTAVPASEAPRPPRGTRTKIAQPPPVPAFYWEPLEVSVDPSIERPPLPLDEGELRFLGASESLVATFSEDAKRAVASRGFVVVARPGAPPASMGALYNSLEASGVPLVVTLDVLADVVHAALVAGLAEVEVANVTPIVTRLATRLGARLETLTKDGNPELARPLRMARGIVLVAQALLDPRTPIPGELEADVREEVRRVMAAKGAAVSALLDVPIDYAAARPVAGADPGHEPAARALGWLSLAPMMLAARDDALGPNVTVSNARDATRAALLFAHALHPRVDAEAALEWQKLDGLAQFLIGPSDDWSPPELGALAEKSGLDVTKLGDIANVVRVDKTRHAAMAAFRARVHDGGGSLTWVDAASASKEVRESRFVSRYVAASTRLFGSRVGLDAVSEQALVYPVVGPYRGNRSVGTLAGGRRVLSRPLDFAAVLGSTAAREALASDGDDAFEGFDATLRKLVDRRPDERESTRHASVYLSGLDLVAGLLAGSAADASSPASAHAEYKKRALETALAWHLTLRHDFAGPGRRAVAPPRMTRPSADAGAPLVLVEPHPEAIGRMVALVRQLSHGLMAYKAIDPKSTGSKVIADAERILTTAFQSALLMANGLPPSDEQSRALARFVGDLGALEEAAGSGDARVVDLHVDLGSGRALAAGTGAPEVLAIVLRDPRSGGLVLTFGGASRVVELTRPRSERLDDAEWRARLLRRSVPFPSWSSSFHFAPPAPPPPAPAESDAGAR